MLQYRFENAQKMFFSFLVFNLITVWYKMYFKSYRSHRDLSFGMKKKGLVPIFRGLEASKLCLSITCKGLEISNALLEQSC